MLLRKKTKDNPIKGCGLSILSLAGLLLACFLICFVIFQLNQASVGTNTRTMLEMFIG